MLRRDPSLAFHATARFADDCMPRSIGRAHSTGFSCFPPFLFFLLHLAPLPALPHPYASPLPPLSPHLSPLPSPLSPLPSPLAPLSALLASRSIPFHPLLLFSCTQAPKPAGMPAPMRGGDRPRERGTRGGADRRPEERRGTPTLDPPRPLMHHTRRQIADHEWSIHYYSTGY